ncbi:MAG: ion transporter [Pseudomonadota bacterium]
MTRADLHALLEGQHARFGSSVAYALAGVILMSVTALAIVTVKDLPPRVYAIAETVQIMALIIFAFEYLLRVMSAPRPLRYVVSFWGIVDLLSFLPALLVVANFASFKALRLMMLFRLLKLTRFVVAIAELEEAIRAVRKELLMFLMLSTVVIFIAAVGIYHFENPAQPDIFSSIPASMWWAVATLTTVGYGDAFPITVAGKLFTTVILVVGLGVIAVPTGLISSALMSVKGKRRD